MDVSIIIVNYNTLSQTIECIDSIYAFTKGVEFEIILVDNSSSDGSKEYFEKDNRVKYIYNNQNYGFGKANNIGLTVSSGNYVFFLNSDTYLIGNVILTLFDFAENHKELNIGELGVVLLDKYGNINKPYSNLASINILKNIARKMGYTKDSHKYINNNLKLYGYSEVGFICGADVFMPKSVLDDIGGFDENYFMLCEEIDLAKRMCNAGYSRIIINNHDIVHLGGTSFVSKNKSYYRYKLETITTMYYGSKYYKSILYFFFRLYRYALFLRDIIKRPNIFSVNKFIEITKIILK